MLRALRRLLGTTVAGHRRELRQRGLPHDRSPRRSWRPASTRVFAGEYELVDLPDARGAGRRGPARRRQRHRRDELDARPHDRACAGASAASRSGALRCDGLIAATPSGSTAYNLSNGGPVLVWGLDAMAVTFVAPHSLHARPLVIPRGSDVVVTNETPDVWVTALADGHVFSEIAPGGTLTIRLGRQRTLARHPAGGDVLQPLPAHIRRLIGCKTASCTAQRYAPDAEAPSHREPRAHP